MRFYDLCLNRYFLNDLRQNKMLLEIGTDITQIQYVAFHGEPNSLHSGRFLPFFHVDYHFSSRTTLHTIDRVDGNRNKKPDDTKLSYGLIQFIYHCKKIIQGLASDYMLQFLLIVIQILIPGKRFYYVHNMKLLVLTRLVQKGFEI